MAARSLCVYKYIMCAIYRCAIVGCSLQDPLCMILYIKLHSLKSTTHARRHFVHRNIFIAYSSLFDDEFWFWTLFPFRQNVKCFVCVVVVFAFAVSAADAAAFVLSWWSSSFITIRLRVCFLFRGIFIQTHFMYMYGNFYTWRDCK